MDNRVVHRAHWAVLVLPFLIGFAPTARASERPERQGFWGRLGGGLGSKAASDSSEDHHTGLTGALAVGGTLSPNVRIATEVSGWRWTQDKSNPWDSERHLELVGQISCALYLYPSRESGVFVKVGAGASSFTSDRGFRYNDGVETGGVGGGLIAGLGYDLPIGKRILITPELSWWYGRLVWGNARSNGSEQNVLEIRLSLTLE